MRNNNSELMSNYLAGLVVIIIYNCYIVHFLLYLECRYKLILVYNHETHYRKMSNNIKVSFSDDINNVSRI